MIPPYIVMTRPLGRFSEAGFLGTRYKPFVTGGDPLRQPFDVEGVVARGISEEQQRGRRELLGRLDRLGSSVPGNATLTAFFEAEQQAYDMILGGILRARAGALPGTERRPEGVGRRAHTPDSGHHAAGRGKRPNHRPRTEPAVVGARSLYARRRGPLSLRGPQRPTISHRANRG